METGTDQRPAPAVSNLDWIQAFEHAAYGLAVVDARTEIVLWMNGALADLLGVSPSQIVGTSGFQVVIPEQREQVQAAIPRAHLKGHGRLETIIVRPDGERVPIAVNMSVVRDGDGNTAYRVAHVQDLRELHEAQRTLQESEERYRIVSEMVSDYAFSMAIEDDGSLRLDWITDSFERMTGYAIDRINALGVLSIIHTDDIPTIEVALARTLAGESLVQEFRIVTRDGTTRWIRSHSLARRSPDGSRVVGFFGAAEDITERKKAEGAREKASEELLRANEHRRRLLSKLVKAQEEERLRISREIHDDSIQVMTAVGLRLDALRMAIGDPEKADALLGKVERDVQEATARLRHLIFELRPMLLDEGGLEVALRVFLDASAEEVGYTYELTIDGDADPPAPVRTVLYRIAIEALTNVRKHAEARGVTIWAGHRDDGWFIRITDDGRGFSTPSAAAGHIGLSSMRERADLAGGSLAVVSEPGQGTTVEAWVPDTAPAGVDQA